MAVRLGNQKHNAFYLCKHLVQAVPPPPPSFFSEIICHWAVPLYRHPKLFSMHENMTSTGTDPTPPELDAGSITDGNNHTWLGDKKVLQNPNSQGLQRSFSWTFAAMKLALNTSGTLNGPALATMAT
ncbi:hypothetical protein SERLA73DRAFT_68631 [Serpula lacrymans var. lacrymans S7.3]|uniref:Uncharacterized protein n=2 Tax=Serpula lacrymans var. lacrymans TaxID=341189 RepID=F8PHD5_SERL3|nr:uncharacterized protein SERLADRAFT_432397 [Serpula lacrymans var. lacrymans S7.9]EGO04981.1 hypothetical protein SERLA73DRAFT_68631 [Serpula lacrymans var. lacrymans S7.3]EGO30772.1 hypothetical protein SERLADRAFT_432397 [Serpula lacrymans var. lacrymans S7.9]